jgi:hypothetical protein
MPLDVISLPFRRKATARDVRPESEYPNQFRDPRATDSPAFSDAIPIDASSQAGQRARRGQSARPSATCFDRCRAHHHRSPPAGSAPRRSAYCDDHRHRGRRLSPAVRLPCRSFPDKLPAPLPLGRSQVARQRILIPRFGGSNPPAPANLASDAGREAARQDKAPWVGSWQQRQSRGRPSPTRPCE